MLNFGDIRERKQKAQRTLYEFRALCQVLRWFGL